MRFRSDLAWLLRGIAKRINGLAERIEPIKMSRARHVAELTAFFDATKGRADGFRFRDSVLATGCEPQFKDIEFPDRISAVLVERAGNEVRFNVSDPRTSFPSATKPAPPMPVIRRPRNWR